MAAGGLEQILEHRIVHQHLPVSEQLPLEVDRLHLVVHHAVDDHRVAEHRPMLLGDAHHRGIVLLPRGSAGRVEVTRGDNGPRGGEHQKH